MRREEEYKMYVGGKAPQVSFCQKTSRVLREVLEVYKISRYPG